MNEEYTSSVTLLILGDDLIPDNVSNELGLKPSKAWENGEQQSFTRSDGSKIKLNSYHEWGGWKKFTPKDIEKSNLEEQLEYWCDKLRSKKLNIETLKEWDLCCTLDIFIITEETASIIISEKLQREISDLGLELRISFQVHQT